MAAVEVLMRQNTATARIVRRNITPEETTGKFWRFYRMNKTKRNPWKNLLFTLLHWILVVLLGMISAIVLFSFLVDTGETYSSFIFSGSVYHVNYVTYPMGLAAFLVGYYMLWKRFLLPDWMAFAGCFWGWKVVYILIALTALAGVFAMGLVALLYAVGFSGLLTPEWTEWGFILYLVDIVVVAIVEIIRSRKRKIEVKNRRGSESVEEA